MMSSPFRSLDEHFSGAKGRNKVMVEQPTTMSRQNHEIIKVLATYKPAYVT